MIIRGTSSFIAYKIRGEVNDQEKIFEEINNMSYRPMEDGKISNISIISPSAEIEPEFSMPFRSPVHDHLLAFDILIENREPDSKLISRLMEKRYKSELFKKSNHDPYWVPEKGFRAKVKQMIIAEEAIKVNPTRKRIQVVFDKNSMILLTSSKSLKEAIVKDVFMKIFGNDFYLYEIMTGGFESLKKKPCPFGIIDSQSRPPSSSSDWVSEFLTWMSLKTSVLIDSYEKAKVVINGNKKKEVVFKFQNDMHALSEFNNALIMKGGLVRELSMYMKKSYFKDSYENTLVSMNCNGVFSGIKTGVGPKDQCWVAVVGCIEIAKEFSSYMDEFTKLRSSARDWGMESAKIRGILK
jgi:hypothetical protein